MISPCSRSCISAAASHHPQKPLWILRAGIPATIYLSIQTTQEMFFHNLLPVLPEKLDLVSSRHIGTEIVIKYIWPVQSW